MRNIRAALYTHAVTFLVKKCTRERERFKRERDGDTCHTSYFFM